MIQRLNLAVPGPEQNRRKSAADVPAASFDPILKPDAQSVALLREWALKLLNGPKPEWLYLCGVQNGLMAFRARIEDKASILLFTTPFAALDYCEATNSQASLKKMKLADLPGQAAIWLKAGVGSVTLDRCPRCQVLASVALEQISNHENANLIWAYRRAAQLYFGQRSLKEFLAAKSSASRMAALKMIRDHWEARWNRNTNNLGIDKDWAKVMAESVVGLCQSFGMEFKQEQQQSIFE